MRLLLGSETAHTTRVFAKVTYIRRSTLEGVIRQSLAQIASACDSPNMRITWRSSWSAEPERHDIAAGALIALLQANSRLTYAPNPDPKYKPLDLPLISFGHFYTRADVPDKYGRPSSWARECLDPAGLSCIALDYDDTPSDEFQRVLHKAKEESHGFAHTTWMHGVKGATDGSTVRARIIMPLANNDDGSDGLVSVADWPMIWEMVANMYNAPGLDRSCRNPERCYFVPATNPASPWPCWTEVW